MTSDNYRPKPHQLQLVDHRPPGRKKASDIPVPGAFAAWMLLLQQWGSWRLRDVLEPAISYAEHGWPVSAAIAGTIDTVSELFLTDWHHSATTWLPTSCYCTRRFIPSSRRQRDPRSTGRSTR